MTFNDLLNQRTSYYDYDINEEIAHQIIIQLIDEATQAPSAYHLQNWQFIAVTTPDYKEKLYQAAYQQTKIKTAPVTFIVCGNMDGYKHLATALEPSIEAGALPQKLAASFIANANESHHNNAVLRRDEAIRSASLASMVLMLSAENKGYATGAMSGFDSEMLRQAFELPNYLLPVMLISVGTPTTPRYARKPRLPVAEKIRIL